MSIIDLINNNAAGESRDTAIRIAGFRALGNSVCSRTIDAVRTHIRAERRKQKEAEAQMDPDLGQTDEFARRSGHTPLRTSLDVRNEMDEANRRSQFKSGIEATISGLIGDSNELRERLQMRGDWDVSGNPGFAADESAAEFGFKIPLEPLQLADLYGRLYQHCVDEIGTLSESQYDQPLSYRGMLKLRVSKPEAMPLAQIKLYAEAAGVDVDDMRKLVARIQENDILKLRIEIPEILAELESLTGSGDTFEELPIFVQHQLSIKLGIGLDKAKSRTFEQMVLRRSMGNLGLMPLFKEAINDTREWVKTFERTHREELSDEFEKRQSYLTSGDIPRA